MGMLWKFCSTFLLSLDGTSNIVLMPTSHNQQILPDPVSMEYLNALTSCMYHYDKRNHKTNAKSENIGPTDNRVNNLKAAFDLPCTLPCLDAVFALLLNTATELFYKSCCQFLCAYIGLVEHRYLFELVKKSKSSQIYRLT